MELLRLVATAGCHHALHSSYEFTKALSAGGGGKCWLLTPTATLDSFQNIQFD